MRKLRPQLLIGHGRFSTLLRHSQFIDYCRERDVYVDEWKLEFLERHELLFPALRIHRPAYKIKIKKNKETNTYKEIGILEESEKWRGPTITEFESPYLSHRPLVNEWVKERLIYIPASKTFLPWKEYDSKNEQVEHLYSVFQLLPLSHLIDSFRFPYSPIDLVRIGERRTNRILKEYVRSLRNDIEAKQDRRSNFIATAAQVLSSRYLPYAEQHGPLVTTTTQRNPFERKSEFNISEYRRRWNAEKVRKSLDLSLGDIRKDWENLIYETEDSPISRWRELVDFVRPEKKKFLKGPALRCEDIYRMARIFDLFYFDLTNERLSMGDLVPDSEETKRWYGVSKDEFQYKEFVVNSFGLNPRPNLILMVEGDSEFQEIPNLAQWFLSKSLSEYEVQVINLKTIGEFISDKIERFIDHNHSLQSIVYFILDNENKSERRRDALTSKQSQYLPGFTITKSEFFTIWEKNIEFDNFTDIELADSLTSLSEQRYDFSEKELAHLRSTFHVPRRGIDPLGSLYKQRVNYGLSKPKLLSLLFEIVRLKPLIEVNGKSELRPILKTIRQISRLATKNYQPTRISRWTEAQEGGWIRNVFQGKNK